MEDVISESFSCIGDHPEHCFQECEVVPKRKKGIPEKERGNMNFCYLCVAPSYKCVECCRFYMDKYERKKDGETE